MHEAAWRKWGGVTEQFTILIFTPTCAKPLAPFRCFFFHFLQFCRLFIASCSTQFCYFYLKKCYFLPFWKKVINNRYFHLKPFVHRVLRTFSALFHHPFSYRRFGGLEGAFSGVFWVDFLGFWMVVFVGVWVSFLGDFLHFLDGFLRFLLFWAVVRVFRPIGRTFVCLFRLRRNIFCPFFIPAFSGIYFWFLVVYRLIFSLWSAHRSAGVPLSSVVVGLPALLGGGGGAAWRKWGGITDTQTVTNFTPTCAKPLAWIWTFLPRFSTIIFLIISSLKGCVSLWSLHRWRQFHCQPPLAAVFCRPCPQSGHLDFDF